MPFLKREIILKAVLIATSILLSVFIAELVLRVVQPDTTKRFVWQPNLQHTFYPDSTIFYGIHGASNFSINAQGLRGENFETNSTQKYLCLGGSTTECLYLDNGETWQYHLQEQLNHQSPITNHQFTISSIGKSGCATGENYIQLKYFVPQLGKIDGVIMMVGLIVSGDDSIRQKPGKHPGIDSY